MTYSNLLAATLVAALPGVALAGERIVDIPVGAEHVAGTLVTPQNQPEAPVVLMLPAFGVSRDGLPVAGTDQALFERAADRLADAGYASLRIDYRGTGASGGASGGAPSEVTLHSHVADGVAALDWLKGHAPPATPSVVLGWSLGGAIAPAVARETGADALVMLNPALDLGPAFTFSLGADQMRAALAEGKTASMPGAQGAPATPLSAAFLRSTLEVLPQADLARFDGPVFMAVGTKDRIVFPQPALGKAALAYHAGPHELMVQPMDHFLNIAEGPGQSDAVFDAVIAFLDKTLTTDAPK